MTGRIARALFYSAEQSANEDELSFTVAFFLHGRRLTKVRNVRATVAAASSKYRTGECDEVRNVFRASFREKESSRSANRNDVVNQKRFVFDF